MELFLEIDINLCAAILLLSVYYLADKRLDKGISINRIFLYMALIVIAELLGEAIAVLLDHYHIHALLPVNHLLHTVMFIIGPFAAYLWYVFIKLWILPTVSRNHNKILYFPLIINMIIVLASPFTGWVYSLESDIYQRGPLFAVPMLVCYIYLLMSLYKIILNKQNLFREHYLPMIWFALVPSLGGAIQVFFHGTMIMWGSAAFSLVVVYIFLQQRMLQFDDLTGAWTKASFEHYIEHMIGKDKKQIFGIIFLDLDGFKKINDTYGHLEGDCALKTSVRLIKTCLMRNDIIARFGGDEFVILALNCGGNSMVDRINLMQYHFHKYNETSDKEYQLSFSCGHAIYEPEKYNIWQFLNHVDHLMYQNKENKQRQAP